jgi:galactokinase/mevalonate kinase-like predicted kinase
LSDTLHAQAILAQDTGDYLAAQDLYQRSRQIKKKLGNPISWAANHLCARLAALAKGAGGAGNRVVGAGLAGL